MTKYAFEGAGGFGPILHYRGEEGLLACDLAANGWNLCFCPALVAYHQPSSVRSPSLAERAGTAQCAAHRLPAPARRCRPATKDCVQEPCTCHTRTRFARPGPNMAGQTPCRYFVKQRGDTLFQLLYCFLMLRKGALALARSRFGGEVGAPCGEDSGGLCVHEANHRSHMTNGGGRTENRFAWAPSPARRELAC